MDDCYLLGLFVENGSLSRLRGVQCKQRPASTDTSSPLAGYLCVPLRGEMCMCGALLAPPTPQLLSTSLCHKIFQTIVQNILYFNGNR